MNPFHGILSVAYPLAHRLWCELVGSNARTSSIRLSLERSHPVTLHGRRLRQFAHGRASRCRPPDTLWRCHYGTFGDKYKAKTKDGRKRAGEFSDSYKLIADGLEKQTSVFGGGFARGME